MYRKIFEEFFPTPAAAETVPMGKSIACSTARALEWDESFKVLEKGRIFASYVCAMDVGTVA